MSATFSEERFRDALRGRRAVRVYAFPGVEGTTIGVRLIADSGFDDARIEASKWFKKVAGDAVIDPELFDRERDRQVIYRATVDPLTLDEPRPSPFFPSMDEVRALDTRTVESLMALYLEHAEYVSPLKSLDPDQVNAFIEALKKGPSPEMAAHYFSGFAHDTLVRLLISLARSIPTT